MAWGATCRYVITLRWSETTSRTTFQFQQKNHVDYVSSASVKNPTRTCTDHRCTRFCAALHRLLPWFSSHLQHCQHNLRVMTSADTQQWKTWGERGSRPYWFWLMANACCSWVEPRVTVGVGSSRPLWPGCQEEEGTGNSWMNGQFLNKSFSISSCFL